MKKLTINQGILETVGVVFGAFFLFIISPYSFPFINIPNNFMGFPIPGSPIFLLLGFLIPVLFLFLLRYRKKKNYIHFFAGLVSMLALLDAYWIASLWGGGLQYLGESATKKVAFGNIICFLLLYVFIGLCYKWRNFYLLYSAAMLLCLTLTFVAFPWFGEYM